MKSPKSHEGCFNLHKSVFRLQLIFSIIVTTQRAAGKWRIPKGLWGICINNGDWTPDSQNFELYEASGGNK